MTLAEFNRRTGTTPPPSPPKAAVKPTAIEPPLLQHTTQMLPNPAQNNPGPFANLGEQLMAVRSTALVANASGLVDPRLIELNRRAAPIGAGEQVPSIGGFMVQPEFSNELVTRTLATGELLSRMTTFPLSKQFATGLRIPGFDEQSRANGSRFGGMNAKWYAEADQPTTSKPKYRMLELNLHKLIGTCFVSDELLQDAVALERSVTLAFMNEFRFVLERSALLGGGAGQPFGVLDPTNQALIVVPKQSGQATATIVYQNVVNMVSRLWGPSTPNALFLISQDILPQLLTLTIPVGSGGGSQIPLYIPATAGESWGRLLGIPCMPSEYCATLGSQNDIVLVDMSQVLFIQKEEITRDISIHVDFNVDQSVYKFVWRCDSQPMWATALIPYNASSTLSPYITLAARP